MESHTYSLYSHKLRAGETVTLGGNEEGVAPVQNAAMYLLFITKYLP